LSDLVKWFEKRRETKALATIQRHLALTTGIVEDLERAIRAAVMNEEKEMRRSVERVTSGEKEADSLRRKVMDEISKGELSPVDREDLMDLVKRVDMVADWSRESTRVLGATPMEYVPASLKDEAIVMVQNVKVCATSLQKCVNKMMTKPEEALQAADAVEREEEKVDDIHETARRLLGREDLPRAGAAILISQLFDAIEMIADACEDACDQVRIIMVRK
jgi:predicted phosphate transport protein (TIGR00153 family)